MGFLSSYANSVGGFYQNFFNPSGYLSQSDVGYYVPLLNQGRIAQENLLYQQNALAYNQLLQQQMFKREDTSIQRRVADLKAAGLSPVLAAGQGAGAGTAISVNAPQRGAYPDLALTAYNLMKMDADISATRASEKLTQMQARNSGELLPAQLSLLEAQIKNADANTYKTYQDAKKAKVEGDNMEKTGTSGNNFFTQWYRDLTGASNKQVENYQKTLKNKASGKPVKGSKIDNDSPFDIVPGLMGPTIKFKK